MLQVLTDPLLCAGAVHQITFKGTPTHAGTDLCQQRAAADKHLTAGRS
ncbi:MULTISPECIES: hypothetical protein [Streptomyces]|nr:MULTISPECIES: hypothetical protein [unclassified Streptomyces]BCM64867.1 hypothetical protein EASAB2608_00201 [Streptomyces sp. EAS-AB2608]